MVLAGQGRDRAAASLPGKFDNGPRWRFLKSPAGAVSYCEALSLNIITPQNHQDGHQGRSDEDAQQPERLGAAKNTQ